MRVYALDFLERANRARDYAICSGAVLFLSEASFIDPCGFGGRLLSSEHTRAPKALDQRTSRGFPKGQYPLTRPRPSLSINKKVLVWR